MTAEQRAREMLERMEMCRVGMDVALRDGMTEPDGMSSGEVLELANLIAECDALKARIAKLEKTLQSAREELTEAYGVV